MQENQFTPLREMFSDFAAGLRGEVAVAKANGFDENERFLADILAKVEGFRHRVFELEVAEDFFGSAGSVGCRKPQYFN